MSGRHAAGRKPRPLRASSYAPTGPRLVGYRCEALATPLEGKRAVVIAAHNARSPRLAARWLQGQAEHLARHLDPDPFAAWLHTAPLVISGDTHAADVLRTWVRDPDKYADAMQKLAARISYNLTVTDSDARYSLIAAPVPVRRPPQFPPPAGCLPSPAGAGCQPAAAYAAL
ncbi:hypothetical protein F7R91_32855 [Streptomyces luteolifulvus]|uniref:Uncharacterized protein n=1 Tax=Streptomyces luteolifulvus TaxID=2615112 RepID=A0A6H9UR89_9ACTN|nr:hypothetical protein [Streptomyces luteolifulvus]KAB1141414.1 hypothetical protein F7R91_32855 [Streptomyces luteolifulvus]